MLHAIQRHGPDLSHPVLRAMFDARRRVFVDLLGWDVPVSAGGFEIDQFDNAAATYLVVTDAAGAHLASARLLPTTRPHILDTLFAHLCEDGPPRSATTLEVTRFCLERRIPAGLRRLARNTLVAHLVAYALREGITTYTGVAEMAWFQQILAFGWRCRPLGMPQIVAGRMLCAFEIGIEVGTSALLAANGVDVTAFSEEDLRHAA